MLPNRADDGKWRALTVDPRAWLALAIVAFLAWVPFLGTRDFWYPDEPDVAEVCQAMYESGDWVAPRRMGVIWVDYPPMIYWAGAASATLLGGVSEFALRLPNASASIALLILVYFVGARWYSRGVGFWAALLLLTFGDFARQAVSYRPDVLFALWISAGLLCYARGTGDRGHWAFRVAGFAMLGLAMLAKGPLGLLLPGLVLTLWHGTRREWRRILELAPLTAVALAVYLPWFVACAVAMGADSIAHELWAQNVARFFGGARGHAQPFYYYLVNVWGIFWPWSLLLPFVLVWVVRAGRWRDRNTQLLLWWVAAFLGFLTIAVTKRGVYLLPIHAAVALLMAPWFASVGAPDATPPPARGPGRVFAGVMAMLYIFLGILALVVGWSRAPIARWAELDRLELEVVRGIVGPLTALGVVLLAVAAWISFAWRRGQIQAALGRVALGHLPIYAALVALVLPAFDPVRTYRPQSEWLAGQIGEERVFGLVDPWASLGFRKMGAFGYYSGRHVEVMREGAEIEDFLRRHPASLVLVEQGQGEAILRPGNPRWADRVQAAIRVASREYWVYRSEPYREPQDEEPWLSRWPPGEE